MHEADDQIDERVFTENTERIVAQKGLPIKVVIGNSPITKLSSLSSMCKSSQPLAA